jgi:hypothetical protein
MKIKNIFIKKRLSYLSIICCAVFGVVAGCKKFVQVPLPINSITGASAFITDKTSASVLNNIYGFLSEGGLFDGDQGVGFYTGLYTDELTPTTSNGGTQPFYTDAIQSGTASQYWTQFYQQIATTNVAIEQLPLQTKLNHKNQWLGEALFMRAFMYSYLVNLYGDVPLAITSDFKVNNTLARSPQAVIYKQMIADLKQAQSLLPNSYLGANGDTTSDKARPNKLAVTALLARTYLYSGDYPNAEAQATLLINNTSVKLTALNQTFLANSDETIWALAKEPNAQPPYVQDYNVYFNGTPTTITGQLMSQGIEASLNTPLVNAFETGDKRFTAWVQTVQGTAPTATYYLATKYQSNVYNNEYVMLFRQAEQYLIRAEARAQQNNLPGAATDLNVVRTRAGLGNINPSTQSAMLTSIFHERQVELFTECGHRFFDLKRSGTIDAVMSVVAPQKSTKWSSYMQLWPIYTQDIQVDPNLKQNPGYN